MNVIFKCVHTGYALLQLPEFLLMLYEKTKAFIRDMSHDTADVEANEHGAGAARHRDANFADDRPPHTDAIELLQEVSLQFM